MQPNQITEKIKESIDNKKYGCGICIDLRKAFDTVNHSILLTKLDHYRIRGIALQWFKSYLNKRKQYVFINGESSHLKEVSCGVIFLIYLMYFNFFSLLMIQISIYSLILLNN